MFSYLRARWQSLFDVDFNVLLNEAATRQDKLFIPR
jgi:hypothetical protein